MDNSSHPSSTGKKRKSRNAGSNAKLNPKKKRLGRNKEIQNNNNDDDSKQPILIPFSFQTRSRETEIPKVERKPADRPLVKLSVSLVNTYKRINDVYFDACRAGRSRNKEISSGTYNNGWDDEHSDYIVKPGELFQERYKVKERIGIGAFGIVVSAEDVERKQEVAIKMIRSEKKYMRRARTEIELLTHLSEKDPDDRHNIVRFLDYFMHCNHQCLVFEKLSMNLYQLLRNSSFQGVPMNIVQKIGKQVLKTLSFLARKDVGVIHGDLKLENILLRHPRKGDVKVIDFGASFRSTARGYTYFQTRLYRSPEVMLGLPYSVAVDMWSLGCVLVEMHTGEPLFSGPGLFDQMQKIVKILGMLPDEMLDRANDFKRQNFFDLENLPSGKTVWKLKQTDEQPKEWTSATPQQKDEDKEQKKLILPSADPVAALSEIVRSGPRQEQTCPLAEDQRYAFFVDLVRKMLAYNPNERIKPDEALRHPFFIQKKKES